MKQIYTGYKWRPMTQDEIEIMDAMRVLPFKSEKPDAGDMYEGNVRGRVINDDNCYTDVLWHARVMGPVWDGESQ